MLRQMRHDSLNGARGKAMAKQSRIQAFQKSFKERIGLNKVPVTLTHEERNLSDDDSIPQCEKIEVEVISEEDLYRQVEGASQEIEEEVHHPNQLPPGPIRPRKVISKMRFLANKRMNMDHAYTIFGQEMAGKTDEEKEDMLQMLRDEKFHCAAWARNEIRKNILTRILKSGLEKSPGVKCQKIEDARYRLRNVKSIEEARIVQKILYNCCFGVSDKRSTWQLDYEAMYMRKNNLVYDPNTYYVSGTQRSRSGRGCIARVISEARKEIMKALNKGVKYPVRTKRTPAMVRKALKIKKGRKRTVRPKCASEMFIDLTNDSSDVEIDNNRHEEYYCKEEDNGKDSLDEDDDAIDDDDLFINASYREEEEQAGVASGSTQSPQQQTVVTQNSISDHQDKAHGNSDRSKNKNSKNDNGEDQLLTLPSEIEMPTAKTNKERDKYKELYEREQRNFGKLLNKLGEKVREEERLEEERKRKFDEAMKEKVKETNRNKARNRVSDKQQQQKTDNTESGDESQTSDKEDDEIIKIEKHIKNGNGEGYSLRIEWRSGTKEVTTNLVAVAEDNWQLSLKYLERVMTDKKTKNDEFIEAMMQALKAKARNKTEYQLFKRLEAKYAKGTKKNCDRIVNKENKKTDGRKECQHNMKDLELEENAMYCREGFKLFGRSCHFCNATMVDKGESEKNKICRPKPMGGARMCDNIEECGFVVCNYCYVEELGKTSQKRTRRG